MFTFTGCHSIDQCHRKRAYKAHGRSPREVFEKKKVEDGPTSFDAFCERGDGRNTQPVDVVIGSLNKAAAYKHDEVTQEDLVNQRLVDEHAYDEERTIAKARDRGESRTSVEYFDRIDDL